jgi:galactose mutarotase-like enzyme
VGTTGTLTAPTTGSTDIDGFDAVVLVAGDLEATFVPQAGMLGASLRHDGDELLDRSVTVADYAARGRTTGIPFLHPWANRLEGERYTVAGREVVLPPGLPHESHGLPIHGVLPQPFTVTDTAADDAGATLTARLDFIHDAFPFEHRVEQRVTLDERRLAIETIVTATGDGPVPVAFGFHPYLHVPGVDRSQWKVSLPMRRHLLMSDRQIPTGEGEHESAQQLTLGTHTFDDGYDGLASEPRFAVRGGGREIIVRLLCGYPAAQVYAPPGRDVICFEPMTAPTNALVSGRGLNLVAPGESFHALFEIQITRVK